MQAMDSMASPHSSNISLNMTLVFFNTLIIKICIELNIYIYFSLFKELRGGSYDCKVHLLFVYLLSCINIVVLN
jgi:hypothetical protein